jgi:hypothetical protein
MLQKLLFRPGVNREGTDYSNEGGYYAGDKIRFRSGLPEKLGGWVRATPSRFFRGLCRAMINWLNLGNDNLLGLGTHLKYYINRGLGIYYDVTPLIRTSTALSGPFTTTSGLQTIDVVDAGYSPVVGQFVTFSGATGFNGLSADSLNTEFQVTQIISNTIYKITLPAGTTPNASGSGGGTVTANYQIGPGLPANTVGNGFGSGVWNGTNVATTYSATLTYTSGPTPWVLLNSSSTTINVNSTTGFPASGTIIIDSELISYSGITSTSFTGCIRGIPYLAPSATYPASTLATAIGSGDVSIPLVSATNFFIPLVGGSATIKIDNEFITYTGITGNTLTGCSRGQFGTAAAAHLISAAVNQFSQSTAAQHGYRPTAGTQVAPTVFGVLTYLGNTGWGNATVGAGVGISLQLRLWTHDNWGENLLLAIRGGPIYYWINNVSSFPRAVRLTDSSSPPYQTDVPLTATNQIIVSDVSRFAICMGCNEFGSATFDPMVVRWSDQEDLTVWTPTATTQAGSQRLTNGSSIIQAKKNRQEINIWTDTAIYSMQYLGPPYVWGFQLLMDNISIMSPNAAIIANNIAYWMGIDKFYVYSGRVETLPCSLRQYVFQDIALGQKEQVVSGSNEGFNEVWWYYVSNDEVAAATSANRPPVVDKYVIYNYLDQVWYYGTLSRTYWLDSALQQGPIAAFGNENSGTLVTHEIGVDDNSTATPLPINAFIQSSDFDIGDGHNFGFVWRLLPDINFNGSTVNQPSVTMTLRPRQNSGAAYGFADNPAVTSNDNFSLSRQYPIQQFTGQVYTRLRARQMAFRIESNTLGVTWQLGTPRIDIKQDGRR